MTVCAPLFVWPAVLSQTTSQPQDSFWDHEGAARKEAQGSPGCRQAGAWRCLPGSRSALSRGGQRVGEAAFQFGHGSGSGADRTLSTAVHHGEKLQGFFFPSSVPGASPSPKREREGLPLDQRRASFSAGPELAGRGHRSVPLALATHAGCPASHPHRLVGPAQPPWDPPSAPFCGGCRGGPESFSNLPEVMGPGTRRAGAAAPAGG